MYIHKLANAAASKPVVTSTATLLLDLITTAGSAAHGVPGTANSVDIVPEDGDVRLLMDGNTPTAANGLLLKQGMFYALRGIPLTKIKLIRTAGSNVTCSVQVGQSDVHETSAIAGAATNVTVTADTEFPAAAAMKDASSNSTTTNVDARLSGFNGTTWDRLRTALTAVSSTLTGLLNTLPWGIYKSSPTTRTDGQGGPLLTNAAGDLSVNLNTKIAGEDLTNNRMMVEHSYSGVRYTSDTLVKSGAGFLHAVTFGGTDAAPTAGSIIFYDNTAESGTVIFSENITTTPFQAHTVILDVAFSTGLYIGFTTTADVGVTPSYR